MNVLKTIKKDLKEIKQYKDIFNEIRPDKNFILINDGLKIEWEVEPSLKLKKIIDNDIEGIFENTNAKIKITKNFEETDTKLYFEIKGKLFKINEKGKFELGATMKF